MRVFLRQLGAVALTATKPLMKQEIDRLSYDVQADPEKMAQNVLDMLRKVPLISIELLISALPGIWEA